MRQRGVRDFQVKNAGRNTRGVLYPINVFNRKLKYYIQFSFVDTLLLVKVVKEVSGIRVCFPSADV